MTVTTDTEPEVDPTWRFEHELDGTVLRARMPKEMVLARAVGIFAEKHAPWTLLIKTAFDFLQSVLHPDSWNHLAGRLNDPMDELDDEALSEVFSDLMDQIGEARKAEAPTAPAPNRAARRASRQV